jgi:APA family basic amino acid/polyamine antiporter
MDDSETAREQPKLKRSISLKLAILYGLGTTIGAGIYVLIGKVAGVAGMHTPVAFLLACGIAALTGLSFAELSTRYPKSAGEAVYVHSGFGRRWLALVAGLGIVMAGVISSAAISNGFAGYFDQLVPSPDWLVVTVLILVLGLVAAWGIGESVTVAAVFTLIEVGGLLLIIWGARGSLADAPARIDELLPDLSTATWMGVATGIVLAFYAFIGFEDIVNLAEETKDPRKVLPRAIIWTLVLTALLYLALALVAVLSLPIAELASSRAPLADLFRKSTGASPAIVAVIGMIAVVNGALIQVIMASRILYGLGNMGWLPAVFARVHPGRRTPIFATVVVIGGIMIFAHFLPIETLAQLTSVITLLVFALVNGALIRIKRRGRLMISPPPQFEVRFWVPVLGFLVCAGFAGFQLWEFAARAG